MARHREGHADTGGGGADDHDLVGVLAGRDLAVQHIVERVDRERRLAVAVLVELRQHQRSLVGLDAQLADLDRLPGVELDVGGVQVQALDRGQQRHRRHRMAVVVHQQRLLAHGAVVVLVLVQVADAGGGDADRLDRLLAGDGRVGEAVLLVDRALERVGRQGLVRVALRLAKQEDGWHQHVARLLHAGGQYRVGVQGQLGFGDQLVELGIACRRVATAGQRGLHLADEAQAAVHLGLDEERGVDDRLGLGLGELVDQLGMDVTRPGPAADVGDALVVDRDDRDPVGGLARTAGACDVVELALQRANQIGGLVEQDDCHHDRCTRKPVGAPELSVFR
jgi:hypothetical protein